ncbi:MAG: hypothetical protein ACLTBL_03280 [Clostridium sp.]
MKYLIMECHMAYAVVLDEDGRFLKAANMDYEVGQTVDTIMEIVEPGAAFSEADCQSDSFYDTVFEEAVEVQPAVRRTSRLSRWLKSALPAAAALCLLLSGGHYFIMSPYGTVRLSINPEVELSVNRLDYVLSLSGINRDGEDLIRGYDYKRKKVEEAAADLAERAIDMDYLAPGGTIYVGVSSAHEDWVDEMKRDLTWELDGRLGSDIHISADPKPDESPESGTAREAETAFPAAPPFPKQCLPLCRLPRRHIKLSRQPTRMIIGMRIQMNSGMRIGMIPPIMAQTIIRRTTGMTQQMMTAMIKIDLISGTY